MTVSFIVPVFNKADYLPGMLAALARQTGLNAPEYIFVNDGSTDESLSVLRQHTAGWPDVTILSQDNRGPAAATNAGIARARHPLIKFVDADDLLLPQATAALVAALTDSGADLAFGSCIWVGDPGDILDRDSDPAARRELLAGPVRGLIRNALFNPSQILVRTATLRSVGGCDIRVFSAQDYSLGLRMARVGRVAELHTPVVLRWTGVTNNLSQDRATQMRRVTEVLGLFVTDHPDLPRAVQAYACRRAASRAWKWTVRHRGWLPSLPALARLLRSQWAVPRAPGGFIAACAAAIALPAPRRVNPLEAALWRMPCGVRARIAQAYILYLALTDRRMLALVGGGYTVSPVDLIVEAMPAIGYLQDLAIIMLGLRLIAALVPTDVMAEFRARAAETCRLA